MPIWIEVMEGMNGIETARILREAGAKAAGVYPVGDDEK